MNFRAFRELSAAEQVDYLNMVLDADNGKNIDAMREQLFSEGHMDKSHYGLSAEQIVRRVVSELHCVSVFDTQEDAINFVECMMFDNGILKDIAKWLSHPDPRDLTLNLNMHEQVGVGIDKDFKEKTTDMLTVVLSKTRSYDNEFGFYVKTAYPNIKHEIAQFTGRDYKGLASHMLSQESNVVCRGFWGLRLNGFTSAYISEKHAEKKVIVPFQDNEEKYFLTFSQYHKPMVSRVDKDGSSMCYRNPYDNEIPQAITQQIQNAIAVHAHSIADVPHAAKSTLTEYNIFQTADECYR